MDDFEIMEEMAAMQSMRGTRTGCVLFRDACLMFLHCIIYEDVLCKSVHKIYVVVVTKIVTFIRTIALNHRRLLHFWKSVRLSMVT